MRTSIKFMSWGNIYWLRMRGEFTFIKQLLLDEVEHDIMDNQNQGLCYLPKPKAEADNTDTRF